jgi:hypothetical protein
MLSFTLFYLCSMLTGLDGEKSLTQYILATFGVGCIGYFSYHEVR